MTPHSRLAPLATAIAFAALLAGCHKGDTAAAAVEGADKINAYIACFNAVEQPLHESYQQYIGWMKDPRRARPARNRRSAARARCCRIGSKPAARQ